MKIYLLNMTCVVRWKAYRHEAGGRQRSAWCLLHASLQAGLFFYPEVSGYMLLQNVIWISAEHIPISRNLSCKTFSVHMQIRLVFILLFTANIYVHYMFRPNWPSSGVQIILHYILHYITSGELELSIHCSTVTKFKIRQCIVFWISSWIFYPVAFLNYPRILLGSRPFV
jgi:hypothetical protein